MTYVPDSPIIQYASDLHLEFYASIPRDADFFRRLLIPAPKVDILVLAGDIGYAEAPITEKFLEWCCSHWKYVIWVYGNHEYYNKKPSEKWHYSNAIPMAEKEQFGRKLQERFPILHILNKQSVVFPEFPDYAFIGATLWTHIPEIQYENSRHAFADFKYISSEYTLEEGYTVFTPEKWSELHKKDLQYILNHLEAYTNSTNPYKCIIVTHHLPSYDMILDQFKHDEMNYGFATNLDYILTKPEVVAWICGHSHGQKQITKGPCFMNARGYPNETSQHTYNPSKWFQLKPFEQSLKPILECIQEEAKDQEETIDFV